MLFLYNCRLILQSVTLICHKKSNFKNPLFIFPGYRFWSGNSSDGVPRREGGREVADDRGNIGSDLRGYSGQDVVLTLPGATTVFDVTYIAVFNAEVQDSLGHVAFFLVRGGCFLFFFFHRLLLLRSPKLHK